MVSELTEVGVSVPLHFSDVAGDEWLTLASLCRSTTSTVPCRSPTAKTDKWGECEGRRVCARTKDRPTEASAWEQVFKVRGYRK